MLVLGIAAGLNVPSENRFDFPWFFHDSAAVLLRDGEVIAAIEEERLNRIKHTTCLPTLAVQSVLEQADASAEHIDRIAYFFTESFVDTSLQRYHLQEPSSGPHVPIRKRLGDWLYGALGVDVSERLSFVPHHLAHAASTYYPSGFDQSLVLVIDGMGDNVSLTVLTAQGGRMKVLESRSPADSLGLFYLLGVHFIGYQMFDEYKVMGLAPYGNPARFKSLFRTFYKLMPEGRYVIRRDRALSTLYSLITPRRRGEPFTQIHKDLAAALQAALEDITFHVLRHWREQTGLSHLCLAGGVAHNSTMNGKLLASGLFDEVFIQPAAHDAGCALGAGILASRAQDPEVPIQTLRHVYWGKSLGDRDQIAAELRRWARWVTFTWEEVGVIWAAEQVAVGRVGGWVQGRSEFGPRALGARSIIADPRPASHRDKINQMIKKREGYRPFAPAVLEEHVGEYFVLPPTRARLDFMTYVVDVQPEKRALLGAITHINGTARVQTVSKRDSPGFWKLIRAFGDHTGTPMLLNTSFNNNAEPIVDSVREALVCFLTTGLDFLVIDGFRIERQSAEPESYASLRVGLPDHVRAVRARHVGDETCTVQEIFKGRSMAVSPETLTVLMSADGRTPLADLIAEQPETVRPQIITEVRELWARRLAWLAPVDKPT